MKAETTLLEDKLASTSSLELSDVGVSSSLTFLESVECLDESVHSVDSTHFACDCAQTAETQSKPKKRKVVIGGLLLLCVGLSAALTTMTTLYVLATRSGKPPDALVDDMPSKTVHNSKLGKMDSVVAATGSNNTLVSVLVPTYSRRHSFHAHLYESFTKQSAFGADSEQFDLELVVFDNWDQVSAKNGSAGHMSPFFWKHKTGPLTQRTVGGVTVWSFPVADARVKYLFTESKVSIGFKRNVLVAQSSGRVLAHMDDDDYYDALYAADSLRLLRANDGAFVVKRLTHFQLDAQRKNGQTKEWFYLIARPKNSGWAFAWAMDGPKCRAAIASHKCHFAHVWLGEEDSFVACLQQEFGQSSVVPITNVATHFVKLVTDLSVSGGCRATVSAHSAKQIQFLAKATSEIDTLVGDGAYNEMHALIQENLGVLQQTAAQSTHSVSLAYGSGYFGASYYGSNYYGLSPNGASYYRPYNYGGSYYGSSYYCGACQCPFCRRVPFVYHQSFLPTRSSVFSTLLSLLQGNQANANYYNC